MTLIGIGPGRIEQLTLEAARAIAELDVVALLEKGDHAAELGALRREILEQHGRPGLRLLLLDDPSRGGEVPYAEAVDSWHADRSLRLEQVLADDVSADERVGILVWGDPSLYDSAIRLLERVNERGALHIEYEVLPGVSSVQLLAARHRIVLNRVGRPVLVTTGRQLAASGFIDGVDDVVVMLDGEMAFRTVVDDDVDIYWGAYLGMEGELLVAGRLAEVADRIVEIRSAAREQRGWVFDVYLLRRNPST